MTPLLLDTNALLRFFLQPTALSPGARQAMQAAPSLSVSAASVWEIATKHRIGKLPAVDPLLRHGLLDALRAQGIPVLPITGEDAERAGTHPAPHRDPFDRMIAAQAVARALAVVSSDPQLDALGVVRIW